MVFRVDFCLFESKMFILIFFVKSMSDPRGGSFLFYPQTMYKIGISICKIEVGFHIILIRIEK